MLGGGLWRARYGADPSIVGTTIRVAGVPSTVVGVMPPGFGFPDNSDLWLPLIALPQEERTSRSTRLLEALGRVRPGMTVEQATTELAGITSSLAARYPDTNRNTAPIVETLDRLAERDLRFDRGLARRGRLRSAHRLRQRRESDAGACGRSIA